MMLTVLKLFAKSALGFFAQIWAFIIAHWRIVLPVAIVVLTFLYIFKLQGQRDDARQALIEHKLFIAQEQERRQIENMRKDQATVLAMSEINARHAGQLEQLRRSADEKIKGQTIAHDRAIDEWRERVRLEIARGATNGLPDLPSATSESAGGGGYSDTACAREEAYIEAIEMGCAITTADYNALHDAWSQACAVHGCSSPETLRLKP